MTTGCAGLRPATSPLRTVDLARSAGDGASRCLAVLLPGRWDAPEKFREAGFARAVASRNLALDLVAVDSHLGYFRDRTIVERLHADVVAPARAAGYDTIWIVGTSLGGLGGLLYLRDRPGEVAGVFAIAPYLGDSSVIEEIERAGGPAAWRPPATLAEGDIGRELWSWLGPWASGPQPVPLHLGWGTADAFDRSNRLLAGLLPPERVYPTAGGHDWKVWERLWEEFLDRSMATGTCASPTAP
jgi:pimeloyl-ACP methyl ester carboxylesterase